MERSATIDYPDPVLGVACGLMVVCSALARGVCLHGGVNLSVTSISSASPSPGLLSPPRRWSGLLLHIPS
eukprot:scaffold2708_cov158-Ochromonas_danica.AAC.25